MSHKFKREANKSTPAVSTAALPDIVFMLLFFFMVAASIRPSDYQQFIELEQAKTSSVTDIVKKDMVAYLYLGVPKNKSQYPQDFLLLLNDKPAQLSEIRGWIGDELSTKNFNDLEKFGLTTQMTIDRRAKVGYVQAIKEQLSYAQAFNVSYAGIEGNPTEQ
ncbi:MAG: biopolymer transporter ExbD [Weeksellaceae bacterium]|nr:biopolymer transporter ExbD [Weeksellaceae bacterium]